MLDAAAFVAPERALCGCPYVRAPRPTRPAGAGMTINAHQITRVLYRYGPVSLSSRCPCCMEPQSTTMSAVVEHTTFGEPTWDSICGQCAEDPHWYLREIQRILGHAKYERHVEVME